MATAENPTAWDKDGGLIEEEERGGRTHSNRLEGRLHVGCKFGGLLTAALLGDEAGEDTGDLLRCEVTTGKSVIVRHINLNTQLKRLCIFI